MGKFQRKIERGGLSDYEKVDLPNKKKKRFDLSEWKSYASLKWLELSPLNTLKLLAIYLIVSIFLEPTLTKMYDPLSAAVLAHGAVTSLLIVVLFNKNKAPLKELFVRYCIMALLIGICVTLTSLFIFNK